MRRDQDSQFEWVNAWAEAKAAEPVAPSVTEAEVNPAEAPKTQSKATQASQAEAIPQPVIEDTAIDPAGAARRSGKSALA